MRLATMRDARRLTLQYYASITAESRTLRRVVRCRFPSINAMCVDLAGGQYIYVAKAKYRALNFSSLHKSSHSTLQITPDDILRPVVRF